MVIIWAKTALTPTGWQNNVTVTLEPGGRIASVQSDSEPPGAPGAVSVGVLLPAPANLHSHAFQRAMAGLSEGRSPAGRDSFWTWRQLMYRFLGQLNPDDIEAIAAFAYMEMLEAGFASVGEFHYLHHQADGQAYTESAELSHRIAAAAAQAGVGLTLLPVLYQQGGCDGRALTAGQARFGNTIDQYSRLVESAAGAVDQIGADCVTGIAPHSLRAVSRESLAQIVNLRPESPVHLHIAEQVAEVNEVLQAWGQRPIQWLLDHHAVDSRWCLVHATQTDETELQALAASGAVAGLCPITEANLGDGIFDGEAFVLADGRYGVGTDSNVRISLVDELRLLEYSQRLRGQSRAVLASVEQSTGRHLFESVTRGGALALGRDAGGITAGQFGDLTALDLESLTLTGLQGDQLLDSYIFAGSDQLVTDVWSAGRHVVVQGLHIHRASIINRYRKTLTRLREHL